tara:strand:- start:84 stop:1040 length:957 start_codon:yes stop_codon:yes gene_type:complete
MKKIIEFKYKPESNNNYIVTILIGKKFKRTWEKFAYPTWKLYCKKNSIGLIVIKNHLIDKKSLYWKKATWQKYLIGDYFSKNYKFIKNVCFLDADIIINPFSPNIFKKHNPKKIATTSTRFNMPYPWTETQKKIGFYRRKFYKKTYPLNTNLLFSTKQLYRHHNLKEQKDEACAGLIIFNVKRHSQLMKNWFYNYKKDVKSMTDNGDNTHFSYHIQKSKIVQWLDYRFQAIWNFEMSWKYPFLYQKKYNKKEIVINCIEASLMDNYFLHFAGAWFDSDMYKYKNIFLSKKIKKIAQEWLAYKLKKVVGKSYIKTIKPK